jgi:hypothetical protein
MCLVSTKTLSSIRLIDSGICPWNGLRSGTPIGTSTPNVAQQSMRAKVMILPPPQDAQLSTCSHKQKLNLIGGQM